MQFANMQAITTQASRAVTDPIVIHQTEIFNHMCNSSLRNLPLVELRHNFYRGFLYQEYIYFVQFRFMKSFSEQAITLTPLEVKFSLYMLIAQFAL